MLGGKCNLAIIPTFSNKFQGKKKYIVISLSMMFDIVLRREIYQIGASLDIKDNYWYAGKQLGNIQDNTK